MYVTVVRPSLALADVQFRHRCGGTIDQLRGAGTKKGSEPLSYIVLLQLLCCSLHCMHYTAVMVSALLFENVDFCSFLASHDSES